MYSILQIKSKALLWLAMGRNGIQWKDRRRYSSRLLRHVLTYAHFSSQKGLKKYVFYVGAFSWLPSKLIHESVFIYLICIKIEFFILSYDFIIKSFKGNKPRLDLFFFIPYGASVFLPQNKTAWMLSHKDEDDNKTSILKKRQRSHS